MATAIVRIEHEVRNFDDWKKVFDSDPLGRQKGGVRRYRIFQPVDNQKYVMIDLEFDNSKQAEAFAAALRKMWDGEDAQRVMQNPQVRILEVVESKEY
jgi:hypothetical protein